MGFLNKMFGGSAAEKAPASEEKKDTLESNIETPMSKEDANRGIIMDDIAESMFSQGMVKTLEEGKNMSKEVLASLEGDAAEKYLKMDTDELKTDQDRFSVIRDAIINFQEQQKENEELFSIDSDQSAAEGLKKAKEYKGVAGEIAEQPKRTGTEG